MNQFQKTPAEREAIKAAKKSFKGNKDTEFNDLDYDISSTSLDSTKIKKEKIIHGIMEGENILSDDYKVYPDYCYVVELKDGSGIVIKSDYTGNVAGFKRDLISYPGYKGKYNNLINIRNCKMGDRNLF